MKTILNAEGAKVTQRAQKKIKKIQSEDKSKKIQSLSIFKIWYSFSPLFCVLCETFAPSAFKN
jgi:hypothetical protein